MTTITDLIFIDEGLIEVAETMVLIFAFVRCAKFVVDSRIRQGGHFWMAAALIILAMVRREMSFLMDFDDFSFMGYAYDAIEDGILFGIYVCILGQLIYASSYVINVLQVVSKETYLSIIILIEIQYIGEHLHFAIIPQWVGFLMEELSENLVYVIALFHLWTFNLSYFERKLVVNTQTNYRYIDAKHD